MERNRKIHVGFLTERMLRGFGVDVVIDRTAKELVKNGFDVTVFCINADGTFDNESYKIVTIHSALCQNPLKTEWSAMKALRRLDCEADIDVWIAETYPFFMATRILSRPVIVVDHGIVRTNGLHFLRRLVFSYIRFIQNRVYFPGADRVVNISGFTQSATPKMLRRRQSVIYNGADNYVRPSEEAIGNFRKKNDIGSDDLVLLYVGRINSRNQPYKGTAELVDIFKALKAGHANVKLVMAGFGDASDKVWLDRSGVISFISADDRTLALLYSVADCYVTASKWEGFDLPLVEAAHFGVPYVAYDVGAHKEVVDARSGFLVKNRQEFVSKLEVIIADAETRKRLSGSAAENAARFAWENAGKEYSRLIDDVVRSRSNEGHANDRNVREYSGGVVDVITLNYNGKEYLENLFGSLKNQTYGHIRVTMVDNGSSDGSAEYVTEKFPWVNVIRSEKNLFFSRGNNLAVQKTDGEYIFFVNNDIIVEPDAIRNMVDTMLEKGKYSVASVGAKMLFNRDRRVFDSVGVVMLGNGSPFNRGIGQIDVGQYDKVEEIFGACFGAILIRRTVYENTVGPLDNSYFGYFEDVDWNYRARIFGYKSFFCPDAVVYHDHSGTSKQLGYEWKYYLIHRNFLKTIIKNFQLRRMLLKGGRKFLELVNHLRKTNDNERRYSIIKILAHITYSMPGLLWKRVSIQSKRCVSDYECIRFSEGEQSFFDAVKYEPILTLDTLGAMFARLDMIKMFKDPGVFEVVSRIEYLNKRKMLMTEEDWNQKISTLIKSLERYIGSEYVEKFSDSIVKRKNWKK